jgi:hypothetical protein
MTCKEYYYNLVKKNGEKIINVPNEYNPILDNNQNDIIDKIILIDEQNIDDLTIKWLEKENKYKKYISNMNKIILDQNQNIDDINKQLLEKENKYKQYMDNMNKIILDQNQNIDDINKQWLEKENKIKLQNIKQIDYINKQWLDKENNMVSIHNKQIQNLTIKYQKQIEKLLNKNPMKLIYY